MRPRDSSAKRIARTESLAMPVVADVLTERARSGVQHEPEVSRLVDLELEEVISRPDRAELVIGLVTDPFCVAPHRRIAHPLAKHTAVLPRRVASLLAIATRRET